MTFSNDRNESEIISLNSYVIPTLLEIMEKKDQPTLLHSSRVQRLINLMIPELIKNKIISKKDVPLLWVAAIIHDIGKIFVEDEILETSKKLDKFEYKIIRNHPLRGYHLLQEFDLPEKILLAVKHHHERWDGKTRGKFPGYPDGISGKNIPLFARIIFVADAYDAMVSKRPYKKNISPEKALEIIKKSAGKQFDPVISKIFIKSIKEYIEKKKKI